MTTLPVEILLVEDNFDDAELTIRELKRHNMANQLVHVRDGEVALDFLFARGQYEGRDNHPYPKVVLLDIQMPKLNGLEVLEQLKKNRETRAIPVVMLTSSAENPDIQRCYDLGANSYIVKPVNFEGFAESIRTLGYYWLLLNQPPSP